MEKCSKKQLAALARGKISILDGFKASQNPEKEEFILYILREAAKQ
ncbi:MAG: hypothetical protein RR396_04115 [Clostridiales bacterium]